MDEKLSDIRCCLLNASSLCNKLADLYCLLYADKIDILFVTESWLHSGIPDGLLDPQGKYSIIRRDRPAHRGGGVCIMIDKTIPYYEVRCDANDSVELVAVDVMLGSRKYRFVNIYRSPSHGTNKKLYVKELLNSRQKAVYCEMSSNCCW